MRQVYLDYAAATPLDEDVEQAMQPYYRDVFYNPSATYLPAKQAREALEAARAKVAFWLGARQTEIVFVAGGTEGNNLAISGALQHFPNCSVTVSAIEHESVLKPAAQFNSSVALVTEQGRVDLADLQAKIQPETVLVSVMYANNEIGTIQPLRQIAELLVSIREQRRKTGNSLPLYLHTDACQAANYLDLHVARLGVDMMTLNGGKLYGPKQTGVLYVGSHVKLSPVILGGGQERGLRSGTENIAGAIGFAAALDKAQKLRAAEAKRLGDVQHDVFRRLNEQLPAARLNGSVKTRLPNNVHLTVPGYDNERLLVQLEEEGFLAAAGSACSASSDEPSHVLRALGLTDDEARSSLRFTFGRFTTDEDSRRLVAALVAITKQK